MRLRVGDNWFAQFEATSAVQALLEHGAAGSSREAWGVVCSRHYVHLGPICLPNRCISFLVLEVEDVGGSD